MHAHYHFCLVFITCVAFSPGGSGQIEGSTSASPGVGSTTTLNRPKEGGCPDHFYGSRGTSWCYHVQGLLKSDRKTFQEAEKACDALQPGSRLASIHSDMDQKLVMTLIAGHKTRVWIGIHRSGGGFSWVDNTTITYENYGNDISPLDKHNCVAMETKIKQAGDWEYTDCQDKLPYVCEYKKDPKIPRHSPYFRCGTDFWSFRGSCYMVVPSPSSWLLAEGECKSKSGHLLSIEDRYEEAFIEILFDLGDQSEAWIGLSDITIGNTFAWSDGWPVLYTNWGRDQPDMHNSCVSHDRRSAWNTRDCHSNLPYVCEFNRDSTLYPINKPITPGKCPDNTWIHLEEYCYLVKSDSLKSWPQADASCRQLGGHLASVHSAKENYFLFRVIHLEEEAVWIGLKRTGSESFQWSDETEEEYFNWDPESSASSRDKGHEACTLAGGHDGTWTATDCSLEYGFVCKTEQITPTTIPLSTTMAPSSTTLKDNVTTTLGTVTPSHNSTIHITTPASNSSHNESSSQNDSLPSQTVIACSVVGGLFFLIIISFILYFTLQRRRINREKEAVDRYLNTAKDVDFGNVLYEDANDRNGIDASGRFSIY